MDNLDKKLYDALSQKIEVPNEYKEIVRTSLEKIKNKKRVRYYSLIKIVTTVCATFLVTTGIVYATVKVVERIWKQPEETIGFYSKPNEPNMITVKDNIISEMEARNRTNEILEKFGHVNEEIKSIKLERKPNNYNIVWNIETNNKTLLELDARLGKDFSIFFDNIWDKDIEKYKTTKEQAKKTAKGLCEKYGYNVDEYNNINVYSNLISEDESYIWYVNFNKKYEGLINNYEEISLSFIPELNEIYHFTVQNNRYEENPLEITKEQAKQIAINEEEKLHMRYKIQDISLKLDIVLMNGDAYLRTKDYELYCKQQMAEYPDEDYIEYRTENRVRKAWRTTVLYDTSDLELVNDESSKLYNKYYTYYIDATTGEIIGGVLSK